LIIANSFSQTASDGADDHPAKPVPKDSADGFFKPRAGGLRKFFRDALSGFRKSGRKSPNACVVQDRVMFVASRLRIFRSRILAHGK
jgi:hypothetical protein